LHIKPAQGIAAGDEAAAVLSTNKRMDCLEGLRQARSSKSEAGAGRSGGSKIPPPCAKKAAWQDA
jgi:hypothetical protein